MPSTKVSDINLGYDIAGEGHPLLLIAGVGYSRWFWHKVAPALAARFRVIAFDNRGAGESDKPAGPHDVPMLAADAAGLLEALNSRPAYVVGHSLGGFIAQELAVAHPACVDRLVLASTHFGGKQVIPITPQAVEVLTNRQGDPVELIRRGLAIACAPGFAERHPEVAKELIDYRLSNPVPPAQYAAQVAAGAGMSAFDDQEVDRRMRAIKVPTLILTGEHDRVVPPGNADLMAHKIAGSRVQIIAGTGHIFPIEDPSATAHALEEFLS
jgi:pimeloyl-ACP methyl ester carboxylesterase